MNTAELTHLPPLPDVTSLPSELQDLLAAKGLKVSWQRRDERSLASLSQFGGLRAITGSQIKQWDADVAARLFSEDNILGVRLEGDLIRNGDLVLCAMPEEEWERHMDYDRARRDRQSGQIGDPGLDGLAEQLRELGIKVPEESKRRGKQIAVHGFDSAEDARASGVKRNTRSTKPAKE